MSDTYDVEMPDGTIIEGVPVGTTQAQLEARLGKQSAPQQTAPAPYQPYQGADPGSDTERFGENPGTGAGGAEFHQGIASTPARLVKSIAQLAGQDQRLPEVVNKSAQVADTGFGTAGRIVGDVAATAFPASVVQKMPLVQQLNAARGVFPALGRTGMAVGGGAAAGGALTPDQQGEAALYGGAGGAAGHALAKAVGGLVRPSAAAQPLVDAGVALTPGQAAGKGSVMKWAEEMATSLPIAGRAIRNNQERAVADANVAAAQLVVRLVDDKVKLGLPPREAIEKTRETISGAYDNALAGMSASKADLNDHMKTAFNGNKDHGIPSIAQDPTVPPQAKKLLSDYMSMKYAQAPAKLDGKWLKEMDSEIGYRARQLSSSPDPLQRAGAPAWHKLQSHIRDLMEHAAAPDMQGQLGYANRAYKELLTLEKSLLPGADAFTPRRLQASLEKMNSGKLPDTELGQFSRSMSDTLPNTVPNSGTPERLMTMALPALLMGGGAGAQGMGWDTVGTGMMAAGALGSRPGARMMTGGYGWQPEAAAAIRALRGAPMRPKKDDNPK